MLRATTSTILVALTLYLPPGPLAAQLANPDFSGTWAMDGTRSESAAQEQPGNSIVTIAQTATNLTVETVRNGKRDMKVYPIEKQLGNTADISGALRAYWQGPVLIDEGSVDINGQSIAFREARTSSANGAEMIVETTLKMEHGYELKGAQTIVTGKDVYIRSH